MKPKLLLKTFYEKKTIRGILELAYLERKYQFTSWKMNKVTGKCR